MPDGQTGGQETPQASGNVADNTGSHTPDNETGTPEQGESSPSPTQTPKPTPVKRDIPDVKVKGVYMTGWTAGMPDRLNYFIELINRTELNTIVLDIKDDEGYVCYESSLPAVNEVDASMNKYDVKEVVRKAKENNIHLVARLVCFKDPIFSAKKPELAVKSIYGGLWQDNQGLTWINPYKKEAWPYIIDIANEAIDLGFDEIQFDYVRFPNDGDKDAMDFGPEAEEKTKYEVIEEFLAYAVQEIGEPRGVKISADVFGIICESPEDVNDIGQYLERIGKDIDYISPMVYPSHYALGQVVNGIAFPIPDLEPYQVVYNSLIKARDRIAAVEGYKAHVRPYLQSFTADYLGEGYYKVYGAEEVREQIQAVYDAGYDEWILWNAGNVYPEGAFLAEP